MATEKSKILIIGGTGYIGKYVVEASAKAGHPTFILVRETTTSDPVKGQLIESFKNSGVTLIYGDLYDHESLVKAMKQVDVVISTVGKMQIPDQTKIIAAIKEAGNVKRFFPSEFGMDVDHQNAIEPAAATSPPRDKVTINGDGTPKAVFNDEHDIVVSLWEKKIGKSIEKTYVPEEQLLKLIQVYISYEYCVSDCHSIFVKGDLTNFEIDPSFGVEATELYPDVKYTTVDEHLDRFV
nr:hypothetical protein [Tanacetum cinerariifolium]